MFGPKLSRPFEVPDYQFPDYRGTTGFKHTQIIDVGTIKKLVMFQIWGQVADMMQVIMIAVLFVMQLGIYCFFGEELIHQVRYW
jgi:hypothetical protein